jgi:hypothetical protein
MQTQVLVNACYVGRGHRAEDYLRQEIAFYESRLAEMGEKGDCAYEHALSKAYQVLLRERKQQLAAL